MGFNIIFVLLATISSDLTYSINELVSIRESNKYEIHIVSFGFKEVRRIILGLAASGRTA
jgi:hypothetical protein